MGINLNSYSVLILVTKFMLDASLMVWENLPVVEIHVIHPQTKNFVTHQQL